MKVPTTNFIHLLESILPFHRGFPSSGIGITMWEMTNVGLLHFKKWEEQNFVITKLFLATCRSREKVLNKTLQYSYFTILVITLWYLASWNPKNNEILVLIPYFCYFDRFCEKGKSNTKYLRTRLLGSLSVAQISRTGTLVSSKEKYV